MTTGFHAELLEDVRATPTKDLLRRSELENREKDICGVKNSILGGPPWSLLNVFFFRGILFPPQGGGVSVGKQVRTDCTRRRSFNSNGSKMDPPALHFLISQMSFSQFSSLVLCRGPPIALLGQPQVLG